MVVHWNADADALRAMFEDFCPRCAVRLRVIVGLYEKAQRLRLRMLVSKENELV